MGSTQEQTIRGLPDRLTIPMRGDGEMLMQEAEPVRMIVVAYRVGNKQNCPEPMPAVYREWTVFGATPGMRIRVTSDRYCPDALRFWQRITRAYVIQRVHVYRSVGNVGPALG